MGTSITIGGVTYNLPPGNVQIMNGKIFVNGKPWDGAQLQGEITIRVEGDLIDLTCDAPVTVAGNVTGNVKADGPVTCKDVGGNVEANGPVTCKDVKGNVRANGPMVCNSHGGRA